MRAVIEIADEFVRFRRSTDHAEYDRGARDSASVETCLDVLERFSDKREWVGHNKTVPLEILEILRRDPDDRVQGTRRRADGHSLGRTPFARPEEH